MSTHIQLVLSPTSCSINVTNRPSHSRVLGGLVFPADTVRRHAVRGRDVLADARNRQLARGYLEAGVTDPDIPTQVSIREGSKQFALSAWAPVRRRIRSNRMGCVW